MVFCDGIKKTKIYACVTMVATIALFSTFGIGMYTKIKYGNIYVPRCVEQHGQQIEGKVLFVFDSLIVDSNAVVDKTILTDSIMNDTNLHLNKSGIFLDHEHIEVDLNIKDTDVECKESTIIKRVLEKASLEDFAVIYAVVGCTVRHFEKYSKTDLLCNKKRSVKVVPLSFLQEKHYPIPKTLIRRGSAEKNLCSIFNTTEVPCVELKQSKSEKEKYETIFTLLGIFTVVVQLLSFVLLFCAFERKKHQFGVDTFEVPDNGFTIEQKNLANELLKFKSSDLFVSTKGPCLDTFMLLYGFNGGEPPIYHYVRYLGGLFLYKENETAKKDVTLRTDLQKFYNFDESKIDIEIFSFIDEIKKAYENNVSNTYATSLQGQKDNVFSDFKDEDYTYIKYMAVVSFMFKKPHIVSLYNFLIYLYYVEDVSKTIVVNKFIEQLDKVDFRKGYEPKDEWIKKILKELRTKSKELSVLYSKNTSQPVDANLEMQKKQKNR